MNNFNHVALFHSKSLSDSQHGPLRDPVELAQLPDRSVIFAGNGTESIALPDSMVLRRGGGFPLFLRLLGGGFLFLDVSLDDVNLLLLILWDIIAGDIEILLLQREETVPQHTRLKVNKPLGIKSIPPVSGLKMEMRSA